jgi:LmbE family N-acetylglucosaminyl deacetylase
MSLSTITNRIGSAFFEARNPLQSLVRRIFPAKTSDLSRRQTSVSASRPRFRQSAGERALSAPVSVVNDVGAKTGSEIKRVLAIGAHPDDVEIGCGATLAKHRAMGDEVRILTLSRGAIGGDMATRTQEATRAAGILGASLQIADLPDTRISDGIATIEIIQTAIRSFSPTHIYTHSSHDAHQDHRSAHAASVVAARGVKNVYAYQSPSSNVDFRPNHFIDVTNYIDKKIEAVGAHESQMLRSASLQADFVVATALYWGRHLGHTMVEPMEVIKQLDI